MIQTVVPSISNFPADEDERDLPPTMVLLELRFGISDEADRNTID